ncbi:hypothetical protein HAX54_040193, partial [Datura stramonium]|nr:hypothetical protein [Datura stramonium]
YYGFQRCWAEIHDGMKRHETLIVHPLQKLKTLIFRGEFYLWKQLSSILQVQMLSMTHGMTPRIVTFAHDLKSLISLSLDHRPWAVNTSRTMSRICGTYWCLK